MDENTLIIIALVAVAGILLGAVIGYLLGGRRNSGLEAEKAAAESRAVELKKQLDQKGIEISRREDEIKRQNDRLIEAESAKAKAQAELSEANEEIANLGAEADSFKAEIASFINANTELKETNATLKANYEASVAALAEQKQFLAEADQKLREAFEALSSEALRRNSASFLETAKETLESKVKESASELETRKAAIETLVKPLSESLKTFDGKISEIELKREGAYHDMKALISAMKETATNLDHGTRQLVSALKTSHVRGRYGEIALRRLIEAAGLTPYSDFFEQPSITDDEKTLRPDCAINLPGHRQLIVDSKVPLDAYYASFETEEQEEKIRHLKRHAAAVRGHFMKLSDKRYWQAFADAPDFVIMYMHIESSYGAALMTDTSLIEDAFGKRVIFATPSTLLAILRTAGYMWQQEKMAKSVLEMHNAGLELYKRANKMLEHFSKIGNGLNTAVVNYNNAVGSMESRVLTQLEKIKDIGGTMIGDELTDLKHVETSIRPLTKQIQSGPDIETDAKVLTDRSQSTQD